MSGVKLRLGIDIEAEDDWLYEAAGALKAQWPTWAGIDERKIVHDLLWAREQLHAKHYRIPLEAND